MSMAWMNMTGQSPVSHALMFMSMWTLMMIAMMLPSVMPAMLLHRRLITSRVERDAPTAGSHLFLLTGYFSVWAMFGVAAYALGMTVSAAAMRYVALSLLVPTATGITLIVAGVYQISSWKRICLRHCRSPLQFFTQHQIRSPRDSWIFGLHHGGYCAGCCWGLMAIQLALGVMSVPLMMLLALVIVAEKQWRHGEIVAWVAGGAAIAAGILLVVRATIRA